jgi:hypothetical protein
LVCNYSFNFTVNGGIEHTKNNMPIIKLLAGSSSHDAIKRSIDFAKKTIAHENVDALDAKIYKTCTIDAIKESRKNDFYDSTFADRNKRKVHASVEYEPAYGKHGVKMAALAQEKKYKNLLIKNS